LRGQTTFVNEPALAQAGCRLLGFSIASDARQAGSAQAIGAGENARSLAQTRIRFERLKAKRVSSIPLLAKCSAFERKAGPDHTAGQLRSLYAGGSHNPRKPLLKLQY
jgi:hypothetical protein